MRFADWTMRIAGVACWAMAMVVPWRAGARGPLEPWVAVYVAMMAVAGLVCLVTPELHPPEEGED